MEPSAEVTSVFWFLTTTFHFTFFRIVQSQQTRASLEAQMNSNTVDFLFF